MYRVTTNLTATPGPEAPGAGAVAHMSLHLKPTMSKSRQPSHRSDKISRTTSVPRFLGRGTCCPSMLATGAVDRLKRRSRPVNGPLKRTLDSVNAFLQFYFNRRETRRKRGVLGEV